MPKQADNQRALPDPLTNRLAYLSQIRVEFTRVLRRSEYPSRLSSFTQAVIVLSAPPDLSQDSYERREETEEHRERMRLGVKSWKRIIRTIKNKGRPLSWDPHDKQLPLFVVDGETEQLPAMLHMAMELKLDQDQIWQVDCGARGVANTKTQFIVLENHPFLSTCCSHLTIITSAYHMPRVMRTASKQLPSFTQFQVIGVPMSRLGWDKQVEGAKVTGEIERILRYIEQDGLPAYPR